MQHKLQSLERSSQRSLNAKHLLFTLMLLLSMTACNDNEPQVINYYLDNPATVQGQLSGKFSVSATKKVSFSQGNLQYNAAQNVWRFATNQYDFVGDASNGNVIIGATACNNAKISNDYNGWIDLFGWGTGDNPTCATGTHAHYKTFTDWGSNAIYNGGNKVNLWRTLSFDEWTYMLHGRKNAAKLFALGRIRYSESNDTINGLILLPDNWKKPDDVNIVFCTDNGMKWFENFGSWYHNTSDNNTSHFHDNKFNLDEWAKLESAGAVFLPAAGHRSYQNLYDINFSGHYWTNRPAAAASVQAEYLFFDKICVLGLSHTNDRVFGYSVRLVR